jgi:hypothetical protein
MEWISGWMHEAWRWDWIGLDTKQVISRAELKGSFSGHSAVELFVSKGLLVLLGPWWVVEHVSMYVCMYIHIFSENGDGEEKRSRRRAPICRN